jgi:hypothetical protein
VTGTTELLQFGMFLQVVLLLLLLCCTAELPDASMLADWRSKWLTGSCKAKQVGFTAVSF